MALIMYNELRYVTKKDIIDNVLTIPQNITKIGNYAVLNFPKLEKIILSDSVKIIEKNSIKKCDSLEEIVFNQGLEVIESLSIVGSKKLKEVVIPKSIKNIDNLAFFESNIEKLVLPYGEYMINSLAFSESKIKEISLGINSKETKIFNIKGFENLYRDKQNITTIEMKNEENNSNYIIVKGNQVLEKTYQNFLDIVKRHNNVSIKEYMDIEKITKLFLWEEHRKNNNYRFLPLPVIIKNLPIKKIDNFYKNANAWGMIVKACKINVKSDDAVTQFKIKNLLIFCYMCGLFEIDDRAVTFLVQLFNKYESENFIEELSGCDIGTLNYKKYTKGFLTFLINNKKDFFVNDKLNVYNLKKVFKFMNRYGEIEKAYPNKQITLRLAKLFIRGHEYSNVLEGNEKMANIVGRYNYTQGQFEELQQIYEQSKKVKDIIIPTIRDKSYFSEVHFEILEKSDPIGLVLGDITNCCQRLGKNGSSCMMHGMLEKNSIFVVFKDKQQKIVGQAWVWRKNNLICIDNVEADEKLLKKNKSLEKQIFKSVKNFAKAVLVKVEENEPKSNIKVTIGADFNSLENIIEKKLGRVRRSDIDIIEDIYTDAKEQYELC